MNFNQFFEEARERNLSMSAGASVQGFRSSLSNEALFQLPLLAMVILVLAKGSAKPELSSLGQLVGECLERTVVGFKGSSQDIGWSANLRIRTVKALTFLERAGLVVVEERKAKTYVSATDSGRLLVTKVCDVDASLLAEALITIERSFENIRAERLIRGEVQ
ncbi:hypothetical protein [Paraburkholderia tropica]|uniref:hypothetical protein n=1 Tax=Paraburkholderia tropica TaxID=92647 RepID=UPI002AB7C074|nr:hypothetical protein [Paraburkholderia tropica]